MTWTGSEHQRREQATCRPPVLAPDKSPRYLIPAGVDAMIRRVEEAQYRPYKTTKDRGFDRCESYDGKTKRYVFRDQGYQLSIAARDVKHREEATAQKWEEGFPCPQCGSYETTQRVEEFGPYSPPGLRIACGSCQRHLKWKGAETAAKIE